MADTDIAQDERPVAPKSARPNTKKSKHESQEHFRAKCRLARWLDNHFRSANNGCQVVLEYPFGEFGEGVSGWEGITGRSKPTRAQLQSRSIRTAFIADIAIIDGGRVTSVIEVVRSHWTEPHKAHYFRRHDVTLFEAMSADILALKSAPAEFDSILSLV